jgi:MoxR-like ATPase
MERVKVGRQLKEFIRLCYRANRPPLLFGAHGVGKSQFMEDAAAELKIGFISLDLSLMEPVDLVGIPRVQRGVTRYAPPAFLPTEGKGIILFEELNRAAPYLRAPCLQFLTARRLNDYHLPPGWLPAAAVNPSDQDKGDAPYEVDALDPALLSRFAKVTVVPDRDEWLAWARGHGIHDAVLRYVESDPTVFDHVESNPRAWEYVSDLVGAAVAEGTSADTLRASIVGTVPKERGAAFLKTLKESPRPLSASNVLSSYPKHRPQLKRWINNGHVDLAKGSLLTVLKYLQAQENFEEVKRSRQKWSNLAMFFGDLPGDFREMAEADFKDRQYPLPVCQRRSHAK